MSFPEIPLFTNPVPLGTFVLLALAGMCAGRLAKKIKLPDVTGQIFAGMLLGPGLLGFFSEHALHEIKLITEIVLGVLTFLAGTHLSFKKLHNASRRVFLFAGADVLLTFTLVFTILSICRIQSVSGRLLLSAIAIATAPGTVVGLIQAKKARGVLVKTLIGVVALNNIAAIVALEICKIISVELLSADNFAAIRFLEIFVLKFVIDIAIGFCIGWLASVVTKHQHEESGLFSTILLSILVSVVICYYFPLSTLLVCMTAGITFSNLSYHTRRVSHTLEGFNGLIFCVFFTLAGTHLHLDMFTAAGIAGFVFVISRFCGKYLAVYLVGRWSNVPRNISKYLGFCLTPQSGLTIGLVISLNEYTVFKETGLASAVAAIALASVVVNEIFGPLLTEKSFDLSRESGQAAARLVDFLQEEYILLPMEATDKWDCIEKMCRFLVKTNHLRSISFEDIYQSVIDREKECSTAMGHGLAVPHARIPSSEHLMGVIGVLHKPVDFDSPDGSGVDIICLVATPEGKENLHLKVLGAIAKIFLDDSSFHEKILLAETAAEAYDLFQCAEIQEINYFLDDDI